MFDPNSRYSRIPVVDVTTSTGESVQAVKLRRLPYVEGNSTPVSGTDRLDIMAHRRYADGTKFWHVADANTELEANSLVSPPSTVGPVRGAELQFIVVPEN